MTGPKHVEKCCLFMPPSQPLSMNYGEDVLLALLVIIMTKIESLEYRE